MDPSTHDPRQPASGTSRTAVVIDLQDDRGFQRAYDAHSLSVYRYVISRLGPDAAEDVTAEVFIAAWRARANYSSDRGSLEAWFMGVATNVIARHRAAEARWVRMSRDTARMRTDEPPTSGDMEDVDHRIDNEARNARVRAAMAHIPPREREPLLLHIVTEMSYEEIAIALDIPIGTVRSRISRGRARLQQRIGSN
jgi:RNA polymerase sigma-70 factor (ECF subfamily)